MSVSKRPISHTVARAVSLALHPLLMAVWCVAFIMATDATSLVYTPQVKMFVIGAVFGMGCVVPLLVWAVMVLFGVAGPTDEMLKGPKSGLVCFLVAMSLLGCGGVFADFGLLFIIRKVVNTLAIVWIVECALQAVWPLSPHTTTLGAVVGIWWILLYVGNVALLPAFVGSIVATGALCTARIHLNPTTSPWRIIIGAVAGFALGATLFIVL
ncbi:MAG: hypothetical protein IJD12_01190 [Tidjanibacter sp.]|nr:hypothetical protein [Tidjanibacter sp.]